MAKEILHITEVNGQTSTHSSRSKALESFAENASYKKGMIKCYDLEKSKNSAGGEISVHTKEISIFKAK